MSVWWFLVSPAHALDLIPPRALRQSRTEFFQVTGGVPGQTVTLVYGGSGPGPCPVALGGDCLDVSNPVVVGTAIVGPDGTTGLLATVPDQAPLVDVRFQAAETGASPSVTPVRTVQVLAKLANHVVTDGPSLELLQRAWSAEGTLTFAAGAWPDLVHLPELERADTIVVDRVRKAIVFDRLVVFDALTLDAVPEAWVSMPGATGFDPDYGYDARPAITVRAPLGPVEIHLPSQRTSFGDLTVEDAPDRVVLDAPLVIAAAGIRLSGNGGDLTRFAEAVGVADLVSVWDHRGATLDTLPALFSVDNVLVSDSPRLRRVVGLGAPGLLTTSIGVTNNPGLTDVSGLRSGSSTRASCYGNDLLPSCDCEALILTDPSPNGNACFGNAPDVCSDDPADLCW